MSHPSSPSAPARRHRLGLAAATAAALLTLTAVPLATTATAVPGRVAAPAATITCASTTPNGRFVRWIYLMILNRCPDAGARTYWTGKLGAGMDRWAFAIAIDYSNENIYKNNVDDSYQGILGRAPSKAEADAAAASIRTTQGDGTLTALLASTDEFYATMQGSTPQAKDQAWLHVAYNGIVDRNPDSAGLAHYTKVLGTGGSTEATRHKVALQLEFSPENAKGWVGAVYGAAFGRQPDAAGFRYWQNWLLTTGFRTFRMWTGFLSSDEGYKIAQTQPNPPAEQVMAKAKHHGYSSF